jgi:mRNA interferase HigB
VHIISRKKLLEFSAQHADAFTPLDYWYRVSKAASWRHLDDVRQVYSSAEAVGNFTVFNIKGNDYRLIVDIVYSTQRIYIKYVLTHAEYDKDKWKNDPYF